MLAMPAFLSCNSSVNRIFGDSRTPHEKYAGHIDETPEGKAWLQASTTILDQAVPVKLPYSQLGKFPAGKPRALALQFKAKQGERIVFELSDDVNATALYADIFLDEGITNRHIISADTTEHSISFIANESGDYILRLQPPLLAKGDYQLRASVEPSLGFPVAGNKARVGSVWGDSRDGGKRSHEGIDIFAAKRTPVIAAADGYVTRVNDGGLGGKTVSMRPTGTNLSLYYAHLDEQWVEPGQQVMKGDTLGLVGNTGNAKTTPPHLHFGIYSFGGAIDPLPFVDRNVRKAPPFPTQSLASKMKLVKSLQTNTKQTIQVNTEIIPLGITSTGYIAELPDGRLIEAPVKSVAVIRSGT